MRLAYSKIKKGVRFFKNFNSFWDLYFEMLKMLSYIVYTIFEQSIKLKRNGTIQWWLFVAFILFYFIYLLSHEWAIFSTINKSLWMSTIVVSPVLDNLYLYFKKKLHPNLAQLCYISIIKTFKIITGIFNYGRHFFQYFSSNSKWTVKEDFKN